MMVKLCALLRGEHIRPWVNREKVTRNCLVWYLHRSVLYIYLPACCFQKWRLELLLLFFALLLFFSSAVRQRGRAQLGITLFYLFLDDIVEPQIVSLWESCIVFNTLKVLQKKNICMRSMTALKFVCKQALKSNQAQLYFLISTGAHNFALKNIFVIWLLP